jgi:hypothetical protein
MLVQGLDLLEIAEENLVARLTLVDEHVEGENDVIGRHRGPVRERRLGAQVEDRPGTVHRILDRLGNQTVHRVRLVRGGDHEAVIEHSREARCRTSQDIGVHAVEGAERPCGKLSAFRGIRVDVVEMREVDRIFQIAEGRYAMGDDNLRLLPPCKRTDTEQASRQKEAG